MRSRKSRRGEWTTTKRGRIVHLAASPPQSLRDYINRARTTSPSATRMSHKDWTNFGGQLTMATALIIGSFSGSNFGDSLVLAAIVHALDERMGSAMRFLVPTNNPGFVERFLDHPRVTSIDIDLRRTRSFRFLGRPVLSVLKSTDVVLTTAGIFFDYRLLDPRFNF